MNGSRGDRQGSWCPQVRCAAVFALGTFVGNSAERTDHSTTIDHNVAMMLAQLINDGSPMVRKVGRGCWAGIEGWDGIRDGIDGMG